MSAKRNSSSEISTATIGKTVDDPMVAVGFRVRSHGGTQFRQWAIRRLNPVIPDEARATIRQHRKFQIQRRLNP